MRFKSDTSGNIVQDIPVKLVDPSALQPRRTFLPPTLEELAPPSEHGLIQPIPSGKCQVAAISSYRAKVAACRC